MDPETSRAALLRPRDFIGQDVLDPTGHKVGTVGDLLLDRRTGMIRFLELNLGLLRRKQVLVPVRALEWGAGEAFVSSSWTKDQVHALPTYDPARPLTDAVLQEMARAHPRFYGAGEPLPPEVGGVRATVLPLSEAKDFKLADGEPDLRGWSVFGADGERVGTVAGMLVDPAAMQIRYLDVDLADDLFLLNDDRHVLLPLEYVELKERGQDVWVQRLSAAEVARLPAYVGGAVDAAAEQAVEQAFTGRPRETGEIGIVRAPVEPGPPRDVAYDEPRH